MKIAASSQSGHEGPSDTCHGSSRPLLNFYSDRWWETRDGVRTEIIEFQKLILEMVLHPFHSDAWSSHKREDQSRQAYASPERDAFLAAERGKHEVVGLDLLHRIISQVQQRNDLLISAAERSSGGGLWL